MENRYFKKLPLVLSSTYTGLMAYAAFIDPHSRQHLGPREKLSQWSDMFRAALVPLGSLCVITALSGALQYYETKNINWAIGSGITAAIMPYTMLIIRPVYEKLLEADQKNDTRESEDDIKTWLGLHRFRVLLAAVATAFFIYAEVEDSIPKLVVKA